MSRLNPGTLVALIVAVLLSVCGAYLARQVLLVQQPPAEPPAPAPQLVRVPVATTDLPKGRLIQRGDIGTLQLTPEDAAARNLPPIYLTNSADIRGRYLRQDVKAGEAFAPEYFYPEGTGPTVAEELEPGLRAVTIRVSDSGLVDGFASPSTMVDVLFRLADSQAGVQTTYTILEAIRVLAVDREAFPGSQTDPRKEEVKVTLAVTPHQAAQLKVLEGNGELFLALRSPEEKSREELETQLAEAEEQLGEMKAEAETLKQILAGAAQLGTEFDDKGRTEELATLIAEKEQLVADLNAQLDRMEDRPEAQQLADVLNLNQRPSIADKLPKGMRAVTLAVTDTGVVDGYAMPGSFVDVLFRLSNLQDRADYQETTFTVVEGVQVLAVDRSTEAMLPGNTSDQLKVTLAVTPSQATKLKVIEGRGDLSLALRSMEDDPAKLAATKEEQQKEQEQLAASLDDLRLELEELQIEEEALQRIQLISEKRGIPFEKAERLQQLSQLIAVRKEELDQLQEKLSSLESVVEAQPAPTTLADALGLPEPPPVPQPMPAPRKEIEIYRGGARQTVIFEYTNSSAPSTAAAGGKSGGCKTCNHGPSVIRRSL